MDEKKMKIGFRNGNHRVPREPAVVEVDNYFGEMGLHKVEWTDKSGAT